ncbi:MAG: hypothetical protein AAF805_02385 [Planctomycetota bacterium]
MTFLLLAIAAVLFGGESHASDAGVIPLASVLAYGMHGARDIREIEPASFGRDDGSRDPAEVARAFDASRVIQITKRLPGQLSDLERSTAFAVSGSADEALSAVHAVLVGGDHPVYTHQADAELWAVVFTSRMPERFVLDAVRRERNAIEIDYQVVRGDPGTSHAHFALIPLGHLLPGPRRLDLRNVTSGSSRDQGSPFVCADGAFSVAIGSEQRGDE